MNIESICNTLFLMSKNKLKNEKNENFFFEILKKKGFENLSFGNILDIFCFLISTKNQIFKQNQNFFFDILKKKIIEIQNLQYVSLNGNSVNFYESERILENNHYLGILENIKTEKNLLSKISENMLNQEELLFEGKFSLLNFYFLNFLKNFDNFRNGVFEFDNGFVEVSYLQEFRRLGYMLEVIESERVDDIKGVLGI